MTEITHEERARRWHEWWDGVVAAAAASPEGQAFADDNFGLAHTGGGCSAWERDVDDTGWRILITDSGGTGHTVDGTDDDHWLVGAQTADGDSLGECYHAGTVSEALEVADRIHRDLVAMCSMKVRK